MNEQTSKERVLKVYPNARIREEDGRFGVFIGELKQIGCGRYIGAGSTEAQAWDDAASRLTEAKLPSSPASEMGKESACSWCFKRLRDCKCMETGSGNYTVPDPLGADISGPKGSHPDCDMWSGGAAPEGAVEIVVKVCPFCGAEGAVEGSTLSFIGYCSNPECPIGPETAYTPTREMALADWNMRATDAAPIAPAAQELVKLARKVIARGCSCYSSKEDDWHAESCPIPEACAALARAERKEGEAKHV